MKKFIVSILSVVFVLALNGCGTKNNTATNPPSNTPSSNTGKQVTYKDGVYDIKHKSTKPGYEEAVVTIKGGKIQNINLKRLDQNSKEIDYNTWDGKHDGYPNLKQARLDLAKEMLDKQSTDVNVITGATQSSNGWKAAVSDALSKAQ